VQTWSRYPSKLQFGAADLAVPRGRASQELHAACVLLAARFATAQQDFDFPSIIVKLVKFTMPEPYFRAGSTSRVLLAARFADAQRIGHLNTKVFEIIQTLPAPTVDQPSALLQRVLLAARFAAAQRTDVRNFVQRRAGKVDGVQRHVLRAAGVPPPRLRLALHSLAVTAAQRIRHT